MGKLIHWELCKKFKSNHTNKTESILKNWMHKILWDFEIQMDHLIRRSDLVIFTKNKNKNSRIEDFTIAADHRVKLKETEKGDKSLELACELKKLRNMKVTVITDVVGALGSVTKGLEKGLKDMEI